MRARFAIALALAFSPLLLAQPAWAWDSSSGNTANGMVQFDWRGGSATQTLQAPEGSTLTVTVNNTIANCIGNCVPRADTWSLSVNGQVWSGNSIETVTIVVPVSGSVVLVASGKDEGFWGGWYGPIFSAPNITAPEPTPTPEPAPISVDTIDSVDSVDTVVSVDIVDISTDSIDSVDISQDSTDVVEPVIPVIPPVVTPPVIEPAPQPQPIPLPQPAPAPQPEPPAPAPTPEPTPEPAPPTAEPAPPTAAPAPPVAEPTPEAPQPAPEAPPAPKPTIAPAPPIEAPKPPTQPEQKLDLKAVDPETISPVQQAVITQQAIAVLATAEQGSPAYEQALEALAVVAEADDPELPAELAAIPLLGNVAGAVMDTFNSIGNLGADISPQERKKGQQVVVGTVIVGQMASVALLRR